MSRFIPGNQKHLKLDDRKYRETLSSSRAGINLTKKELHQKDMIISPLILNGQSPYHILADHPELDMSVRTMYSYLDMGLFSARDIDLKRKGRFKPRKCHKTQITDRSVFKNRLYSDFCSLFEYILTDRGSEFGDPEALEKGIHGIQRSSIYYCDPMQSGQKGGTEQAHTLLRMILPKGSSFEFLTQWDVNLIVNHINSTPRESLSGMTPYSLALETFGEDTLNAFQLRPIDPDKVNLTPKLIRFNH